MTHKKILLLTGVGIAAVLFIPQVSEALGLKKKSSGVAPKRVSGQPITQPKNSAGSFIGDLLRGLLKPGSDKPGGGLGLSGGGNPGSMASGGGAKGGVGTGNFNGGNFGSYVVAGQLYNADGYGLDENGRIIPDVFDNSGLGPAGAGINFDGTLASNPLEYSLGSPIYGVAAPLNNPDSLWSGYEYLPADMGTGDSRGLLADARASESAPALDTDLTQALLPSIPLPNMNVMAPTNDNEWSADSAINNTPPDIAYGADEYVDAFPPADAVGQGTSDDGFGLPGNYFDESPTPDYTVADQFIDYTDYGYMDMNTGGGEGYQYTVDEVYGDNYVNAG